MRIRVTQDHIDRGVKCDCIACPVALAVRDAMPGFNVEVSLDEIIVHKIIQVVDTSDFSVIYDSIENRFSVPHEVADFIRKFDEPIEQVGIHPFEFDLT